MRKNSKSAWVVVPSGVAKSPLRQHSEHYDPLRAAFYVNWDSNSLASLQLHYHDIHLLIAEELHAFTVDGSLAVDKDLKLDGWLKTLNVEMPMMPLLNNYDDVWQVQPMADMLANSNSRQHLESCSSSTHNRTKTWASPSISRKCLTRARKISSR